MSQLFSPTFRPGNRKDASLVSDLVLLLANAKADAILESNKIPLNMMDQILLTADQVVVYDNKILEKPQNKDEARMFIEGYGLLPCSTVGSIVLTDLTSKKRVQGVDICNIYFDPIPENIIQQLLDEGNRDFMPSVGSFIFQCFCVMTIAG